MKKLMLAAGAAALCSAGALAAARTPVAITGCVHAGTDPDTYVLLDVDEVTGGRPVPAGAVYWLSSTRQLKDHVGKRVEVRGAYSLDGDFGKTATSTAKTGGAKGEQTTAPKNGANRAAPKEELRAVGTTGVPPREVKRPYRRLDVTTVKMIAASCDVP